MEIICKEISVTAEEVADVFIGKIESFDIDTDADGDFNNKFDFEHEFKIGEDSLIIYFFGKLSGNVKNDKLGDEPDTFEIESRYFEYQEFAAYLNGDDVKINEDEIIGLIEKAIQI